MCTNRSHPVRMICEPLGIVLPLDPGAGMSRIEADHVEPAPVQFMDKPGCHRAGLQSDTGIGSCMTPYSPLNWFRQSE